MTYALTFLSGVAVAAVLMWYYVGVVTKSQRSPRSRLIVTADFIYSALIRAGRNPNECQMEALRLAQAFTAITDKVLK